MPNTAFFKILDTVDSTNNYAMAKVRLGLAKHGMAFVAMEQTDGKGQRGKSWQMQKGQSIAMSLVVNTNNLRADQQFYLSMLIALAANDFLKTIIPGQIFIKWPNDLYWRDRKAGGILIETVFKGATWQWAVVGIGINVNQTKFSKLLPNPISIQQITGQQHDVVELAAKLYNLVMKRLATINEIPAEKILEEYNQQLYKINETVKLKKANAVFSTAITGVCLQGRLHAIDTMERQFDFGEVEWVL